MASPVLSTYRLQMRGAASGAAFTFDDAVGVLDYLHDLGVSHLYLSPILTAAEGSTHGYDVTDPTMVSPALGGPEGFERLATATKARGMGLIVDIVPFMDTACADGWSKALGDVAKEPFTTLIPGHGPVMTRADFTTWRTAYDNFVKCGHSDAAIKTCIDGWSHDAAKFIDDAHRQYVRDVAGYYLQTRLRSSPEEQQKYCKPLKA